MRNGFEIIEASITAELLLECKRIIPKKHLPFIEERFETLIEKTKQFEEQAFKQIENIKNLNGFEFGDFEKYEDNFINSVSDLKKAVFGCFTPEQKKLFMSTFETSRENIMNQLPGMDEDNFDDESEKWKG